MLERVIERRPLTPQDGQLMSECRILSASSRLFDLNGAAKTGLAGLYGVRSGAIPIFSMPKRSLSVQPNLIGIVVSVATFCASVNMIHAQSASLLPSQDDPNLFSVKICQDREVLSTLLSFGCPLKAISGHWPAGVSLRVNALAR